MIKGAIFDFDGTLFDSMHIWDSIGEEYLHSIGINPEANIKEVLKPMSLQQAACYFQKEYGVTYMVDEITQSVNDILEKYYFDIILPKPGVKNFLSDMLNDGIKICIATATDKYLIDAALERCDMKKYFTEIVTCTSVGSGKDRPFIFQRAMNILGTNKNDTLVFEDSVHAIKTSVNDGFVTVGVYDEHQTQQNKIKGLTPIYITDFSRITLGELKQFLKQPGGK